MEGGGGAGEVRKVHVVYFLSRNGEMEHPHLIRVRHRPHRDGVRLRDVKRWLSELRGKDMPDAFAWSYKRRYKTGYVWQDLADDDLITPVSDNEYVLKGSLTTSPAAAAISAASTRSSSSSTVFSSPTAAADCVISPPAESGSTDPTASDPFPRGDPKSARPSETPPAENRDRHDEVSPKPPPPVDEEEEEDEERQEHSAPPPQHSEASTQTVTRRAAAALHVDLPRRADPGSPLPVSDGGSCEIEEEAQPEQGGGEDKKDARASDSRYSLFPGRRRGHAWCGGAGGRPFRSFLGCGACAAEVDAAALLSVELQRRGQLGGGGARESREGGKSGSRSRVGEAAGEQKTTAVRAEACKPAAEPSCSQCGRPFKPERLHAHMKSCRALKGQRKNMRSGKLATEESHSAMLSEEASSLFLLSH